MVDNTIALQGAPNNVMNSFSQGRAQALDAMNAKREQAEKVMQHIGAVSLGAMGGNLNGQVDPAKYEQGLDFLESTGIPVAQYRGRPDMAPLAARASMTALQQLQAAQNERELLLTLEKFDQSMAQTQRTNDIADRSYNLQRERLDYLKGKGQGAQSSLGKLKMDLDSGLIDKPTYDAAVKKATSESGGIVVGPDGSVTIGGQLGKLTEGQSKDVGYITRGAAALKTLRKYESALTGLIDSKLSGAPLGNYMTSTEYQQGDQAAREFLAVILRKDTGAAVTDQEMKLYTPMFLPEPGNPPEVIEQKRLARLRAIEAIRRGLGAKADIFPPITDEEDAAPAPAGRPGVTIQRSPLPNVQDGGDPDFEGISDEELEAIINGQ